MRTITSIAMALTVAGGVLAASLPASAAETVTSKVYYDGQVHKSSAQPYNGPETNTPTAHFYYDGQYHPTYEPAPAAGEPSSNTPTGRFYYDGQFHDTYVR